MRKIVGFILFIPLMIAGMAVIAVQNVTAQANRASITGTVTDSSNAVLVGVQVIATNLAANVATKTVSNAEAMRTSAF